MCTFLSSEQEKQSEKQLAEEMRLLNMGEAKKDKKGPKQLQKVSSN